MHERDLLRRRRSDWERLSNLIQTARRKGLTGLSPDDLAAIGPLYRRAVSDLAFARSRLPGSQLVIYLNQLVARAHALIYGGAHMSWRGLLRFFTRTFPSTVREQARTILFIAALFAVAAIVGAWGWHVQDPRIVNMMPPQLESVLHGEAASGQNLLDPHERPLVATMIMTNNFRVSMLAFALGATFGVGTLWVIWYNGLLIGPLALIYHRQGLGILFWSLILPHGVLELSAIFFSAAAGWLIGRALLRPGELRRLEAARQVAPKALILLGGTVGLLTIAGVIEGFFTPSSVVPEGKLMLAGGVFLLLLAYLYFAGRAVRGGAA